ncbi:hypothetical protein BDN72DRAFT_779450, partial [Pluteus cervinus]
MERFDKDPQSRHRKKNIYYPFRDFDDWKLACFLLRSGLSMASIDEFLKLPIIERLELSFGSAKTLRDFAEALPSTAPWKFRPVKPDPRYPLKKKLDLYFRNPLEVIKSLLENPLIADHIHFTP